GCIIRSAFMQELVSLFAQNPMTHILLNKKISLEVRNHRGLLVDFVASALGSGCPASVFSAAANYLLSYTSEETSANMIQAQRDFFGAHTFERTDKPRGEYFHAHWNTNK
ncbi:MAG: NADP-dependent phosphogluconate dehydrogenase, partial [Gillisia sp.]